MCGDVGEGNEVPVDCGESRADGIAGRVRHHSIARLAVHVRLLHVAHLHAVHVHRHGGKAVPAGDERQQKEHGDEFCGEGALHESNYAQRTSERKVARGAERRLATS
jgi:hypothetical protein